MTTPTATSDRACADLILDQLGGVGRLIAMTGAKNFLYDTNSLTFKLGAGATNKATHCTVKLDRATDTYAVTWHKVRGTKLPVVVGESEMVYCDSLRRTFETATGFYLSL